VSASSPVTNNKQESSVTDKPTRCAASQANVLKTN